MRNGRKGECPDLPFLWVLVAVFLYDRTPSGNRGRVSGFFHSQIQDFHPYRALDRDCDHRHPCGYAPACLEQGEVKGC